MAKVGRRHRQMVVDLFTLAPVLESPLSRWARGEPARTAFEQQVQYPQWSEMAERCARIEASAEKRGLEAAAQWHESEATTLVAMAGTYPGGPPELDRQAEWHRECARLIREESLTTAGRAALEASR
jgi:hypothetical protein